MMTTLSLDPSTADTGAVICRMTMQSIEVLAATRLRPSKELKLTGDTDMQRIQKIAYIRETLEGWLLTQDVLDGVAYEMHIGRGQAASEAGSQTVGALLTIPGIPRCRQWRIYVPTAKAVWGGNKMPTEVAKPAVVRWARLEFAKDFEKNRVAPLSDDDDAIADALAVAVAAWGKWKAEEIAKQSPRLTGRRGGKF
jgi:Holliday junction resolvasome RuvABC endonuclease subunit